MRIEIDDQQFQMRKFAMNWCSILFSLFLVNQNNIKRKFPNPLYHLIEEMDRWAKRSKREEKLEVFSNDSQKQQYNTTDRVSNAIQHWPLAITD